MRRLADWQQEGRKTAAMCEAADAAESMSESVMMSCACRKRDECGVHAESVMMSCACIDAVAVEYVC